MKRETWNAKHKTWNMKPETQNMKRHLMTLIHTIHTPSCSDSAVALHRLLESAPPVGEAGWVALPMPQECVVSV